MDLFDFNHDGEVSDLERIMGLAAVLSEANPDIKKFNIIFYAFFKGFFIKLFVNHFAPPVMYDSGEPVFL